jgi:hypothetical protein
LYGCARANVCEVLTHPHFSEEHRTIENVIAWCAAAISPFSFYIICNIIGAHLLAVAINTTVGGVNPRAALEHSRLRLRVNVRSLFIGFRIEMSDLPVRDDGQPEPRKGERAENSKKQRS